MVNAARLVDGVFSFRMAKLVLALPHLHRDGAHPCPICTRTALSPATSAPGRGSPVPHLHRDCARLCPAASAAARPVVARGPVSCAVTTKRGLYGPPSPGAGVAAARGLCSQVFRNVQRQDLGVEVGGGDDESEMVFSEFQVQSRAALGLAWLGLAWLGLAWLGLAWLGLPLGPAAPRPCGSALSGRTPLGLTPARRLGAHACTRPSGSRASMPYPTLHAAATHPHAEGCGRSRCWR